MKAWVENEVTATIDVSKMQIGQLGKMRTNARPFYSLILCTYDGFVNLGYPRHTWTKDAHFNVELLPIGTRVILESEI